LAAANAGLRMLGCHRVRSLLPAKGPKLVAEAGKSRKRRLRLRDFVDRIVIGCDKEGPARRFARSARAAWRSHRCKAAANGPRLAGDHRRALRCMAGGAEPRVMSGKL